MNRAPRIVIIGSENSGKTSLCESLAARLNIDFNPEYAREYSLLNENELTYEDVMPIAKGQNESELEFINESANSTLIFDTNLLSTIIYSKMYYSKVPDKLLEMYEPDRYDYYLLFSPVDEWQDDGVRMQLKSTVEMHKLFESELKRFGINYLEISGDMNSRIKLTCDFIDKLFL
jgi:NadR type nicotinamide-nucleotide adenylyltransferase